MTVYFVLPFVYHRMQHIQGVSVLRRETSRATSSYENKEKHNRNVRPEVSAFIV